jgi:hypothetical protein
MQKVKTRRPRRGGVGLGYVHREDKTTADPIQRVSGEFGGRIDAKRWCDIQKSRKPAREDGVWG